MHQKMIALKTFRYATRALVTGDDFDASRRDARILEAIGKARRYVPPAETELDRLRARAGELGIVVDNRWREARLTEEIEAATKPKPAKPPVAFDD